MLIHGNHDYHSYDKFLSLFFPRLDSLNDEYHLLHRIIRFVHSMKLFFYFRTKIKSFYHVFKLIVALQTEIYVSSHNDKRQAPTREKIQEIEKGKLKLVLNRKSPFYKSTKVSHFVSTCNAWEMALKMQRCRVVNNFRVSYSVLDTLKMRNCYLGR